MIWTIAKREFLDKILDFRVTISFIIAIVLTSVAIIVSGEDYLVRKAEYDKEVARQQSLFNNARVYSEYNPVVLYPPTPLCVFSHGIDIPTPITAEIVIYNVPFYSPRAAGLNPIMNMFDTLDILLVVRVLFSLLVILLTFDAFSGEKELGTLRQVLSNPTKRGSILLGKFFGTMMILGTVTCLTFLFALIILGGFVGVFLSMGEVIRVGLIAGLTILYLAVFAGLGILGSIMLHRSAVSLAVLLLIWFFVAVFQPELNTYIVSEFDDRQWVDAYRSASAQNDCDVETQLANLQKQSGGILTDSTKHIFWEAPGRSSSVGYGSFTMYKSVTDADPDVLDYLISQVRLFRQLKNCGDKDNELYNSLCLTHLNQQLAFKRQLEFVSPAALFSHGIGIFSQTDIDNIDAFYDQVRRYRESYFSFLDQKGVFSTDAQLYFSRLRRDQLSSEATNARIAAYLKDRSSIPWNANCPPLDLRDAPAFASQGSDILQDFNKVVPIFLLLLLYLILFLIATVWSLQLYDPR